VTELNSTELIRNRRVAGHSGSVHLLIGALNSTLVATSRTLVAILENFQTKDGHIAVPEILQKYVGKKTI